MGSSVLFLLFSYVLTTLTPSTAQVKYVTPNNTDGPNNAPTVVTTNKIDGQNNAPTVVYPTATPPPPLPYAPTVVTTNKTDGQNNTPTVVYPTATPPRPLLYAPTVVTTNKTDGQNNAPTVVTANKTDGQNNAPTVVYPTATLPPPLPYAPTVVYPTATPPPPLPSPPPLSVTPPPPPPPPSPPPSTNGTTKGDNNSSTIRTTIMISVPVTILLILTFIAFVFFRLTKREDANMTLDYSCLCNLSWIRAAGQLFRVSRQRSVHNAGEDASQSLSVDSLRFDFATIRAVTNDFSSANMLGHGGFGSVYKGKLANGQEIAVKRLDGYSGQGEVEFKNEIVLMAKLQHKNLVRLLGFCFEGKERLLVYEFVPNASLDRFIFHPTKRMLLSWDARYKIMVGIARGLVYLHQDSQLKIIHHDLKAGNVLLDGEMNPKIADFGMARLFVLDQSRGTTRRIVGTFGYMPPEFVMYGQFSVKTDVFSFGVLILEMVSGKKYNSYGGPEHGEHLVSYAWKEWRKGKASKLIDETLVGGLESEMMRCIHIGLLCVQENVANRPTMSAVVLMFNSYSMGLPLPSKPAFLIDSSMETKTALGNGFPSVTGSNHSQEQAANLSVNEASITEPYPR